MNKYRVTYTTRATKIGGEDIRREISDVEAESFDIGYGGVLQFYDDHFGDIIVAYHNWDMVILLEKGKEEFDDEQDDE